MRRRYRFATWLGLAFALAVAVRWFVAWYWYRDLPLGDTDNFFYHRQANLLADGEGFTNPFTWPDPDVPTAAHPPAHSTYLALWSLVGLDSPMWHRLAGGVISAAVVVPVGLLVRRLAGFRAGVLAALAAALYPPLWMNDGLILSESTYVFLAGAVLWQAHRVADEPSVRRVVELSVVLALATLTRSETLLLYAALLTPLVLTARSLPWRDRVARVGIAAVVAVLVMAPWVVRNLASFEEPTFVAVGAGYVLELANCDETYSGDFLGYWSFGCETTPWPDGDESVAGAAKLETARAYILDHLDEQPKVMAARVGRLFGVYRPIQTGDFDVFFERRIESHVWIGLGAHYVVGAMAIWGAVLLRRRGETLLPTLTMIGLAALTAAISFGISRYRVGADVALLVLAAVAAGRLLDRWWPASGTVEAGDQPAEPVPAAAS